MDIVSRTIVLGAAIIVIVGITAGLRVTPQLSPVDQEEETSPEPSPSAEAPTPSPEQPSDEPEESVEPSPSQGQIKGITTSPFPSPEPEASIAPGAAEEEISISFVDLPAEVKTGQEFMATWRVEGPTGTVGESTKLAVLYNVSSAEGGSNSSVNSSNKQSFGSFQIPDSFSADFKFGSIPGQVQLTAEAIIDGKTYTKKATVELTD